MKLSIENNLDEILVVAITPYFLEKGNVWFEKNLKRILRARRTKSFFEDNTIYLEKDQIYNFSQFLRRLDEMGYEKVLRIGDPGDFSQRGGIIDVFPINQSFAVRIEFLGNKIENIFRLSLEIKKEKTSKELLRKKLKSQKLLSDLKGLKPGDCLVHLDHGIGVYRGRFTINKRRYYKLEYDQGDTLYVPFGLERKLSQYIGFVIPKVSRLGSSIWQRTKKRVREEAEKLAKELLDTAAKRGISIRPAYLPDDEINSQLALSFPYEETSDQIRVIEDIKKDLESNKPMDRIVCGDVGFGKTEVAMRAIIKVINSGYQATMICPTTILANQHFQNFRDRLAKLPIKIALLSRLQLKKEQNQIIKKLEEGEIDLLIGTHRILSKDVDFKNLGLLVIDDEHKFGVKQKERLKKKRVDLDVLSLSATPIPRTMYLTLSSLKDISLIQTPPIGRLPVKTLIRPWSEKTIREAIKKEISRGGQVYYLHNRIETITTAKRFLEKLTSGLNHKQEIGVAHGRLKETELVRVMKNFQDKKINILVATTIIEAGIDLPNVNTLIVAESTKLGLAQAYQIRGRIGRSHIQAVAYFLYGQNISDTAKERLDALKKAESLGSGFKIALKDLEIRGAGNILGREQSGNINQVGLNLYCQILSEIVEKIKQNPT